MRSEAVQDHSSPGQLPGPWAEVGPCDQLRTPGVGEGCSVEGAHSSGQAGGQASVDPARRSLGGQCLSRLVLEPRDWRAPFHVASCGAIFLVRTSLVFASVRGLYKQLVGFSVTGALAEVNLKAQDSGRVTDQGVVPGSHHLHGTPHSWGPGHLLKKGHHHMGNEQRKGAGATRGTEAIARKD